MKSSIDHAIISVPVSVTSAQAMSGGLVYGFPSMTAFLGLENYLSRKIASQVFHLDGITVCVHSHRVRAFKDKRAFVPHLIRRTGDTEDAMRKIHKGQGPSLVENIFMDMDITLLFRLSEKEGVKYATSADLEGFKALLLETIFGQARVAGGIISKMAGRRPRHWLYSNDAGENAKMFSEIRRHIMPGFLPFDRTDILAERLALLQSQNPDATILDAWLESIAIRDREAEGGWEESEKKPFKRKGWVVPACLGFASLTGIMPPGSISGARDMGCPVSMAEPCYSLLEFVSAHKIEGSRRIFWQADIEERAGKTFFLVHNM